jgi:pyruvate,water dikinase
LSHAAIVAREHHIPAVVGSKDATRLIPDGARIRIDGNRGEALVL